jgi:hypothetical protein
MYPQSDLRSKEGNLKLKLFYLSKTRFVEWLLTQCRLIDNLY